MTTEKKMRTSATAWRTLSVILQKRHAAGLVRLGGGSYS